MANSNYLSFDPKRYPVDGLDSLKLGIVRSEWNPEVVNKLYSSCEKRLIELGLSANQIVSMTVPGSFELPWGAKQFLTKGGFDGVICFGCVIQGETKHDDYINHAISKAIMTMNLTAGIPISFGVLTTNTLEQAKERAGGKKGNKGTECAEAILKMISASQQLKKQKSKIGF